MAQAHETEAPSTRARRVVLPGVALFLVVSAGYALGSAYSVLLLNAFAVGAVFYPPAGVTLAALALTRTQRWPWILAATATTEYLIDRSQGFGPAAAGLVLANVAEPVVGALLLRRAVGPVDLSRGRHLAAFVGWAVVAGPLVGATIGAATISLSMHRDFLDLFGPFWAGDGLGVLTVGGAILAWRASPSGAESRAWGRGWALVVLTGLVTIAGFWPTGVPLAYLPLPVLFWIAFRHRLGLLAAAGLLMALTANVLTAVGHGPWGSLAQTPQLEAASLQLYLAVTVLSAWVLAVQVHERELAWSSSRRESSARQRVQALQEITARLTTAATSQQIAEVIVQRGLALVADHGVVGVVSADGTRLRIWSAAGRSADLEQLGESLPMASATLVAESARTGRPVVVQTEAELAARFADSVPLYRRTGVRSALAVPAQVGGETVGALSFGFQHENGVDVEVQAFAQTLAQLTAEALGRARLYELEREAAHQLQRALLPVAPAEIPGARLAVRYIPADQEHDVGGDWYDVFELPGGRVGFAVGDVMGHDLRAAAAMGRLQAVTRVLARTAFGPAGVLRGLDEVVLDVPDALMATVGYGDYDAATGRLRYACAGHLPPLLRADTRGRYLPGGRSQPLGMAVDVRHDAEVVVDPGALLVWFTDGLVERRDEDIDVGLDRVAQVVSASRPGDPQACCDSLITAMVAGRSNIDDVALLCLGLDRLPVATAATVPPSERRLPGAGVATLRSAGPGRSAEARGLAP